MVFVLCVLEGRNVSQYFLRSAARSSASAEEGFAGRFSDFEIVSGSGEGAFWMEDREAGLERERR